MTTHYVIWRTSCPGCGTSGVVCLDARASDAQLPCPECGKENMVALEEGLPADLSTGLAAEDPFLLSRKALANAIRRIRLLERSIVQEAADAKLRGQAAITQLYTHYSVGVSMAARAALCMLEDTE